MLPRCALHRKAGILRRLADCTLFELLHCSGITAETAASLFIKPYQASAAFTTCLTTATHSAGLVTALQLAAAHLLAPFLFILVHFIKFMLYLLLPFLFLSFSWCIVKPCPIFVFIFTEGIVNLPRGGCCVVPLLIIAACRKSALFQCIKLLCQQRVLRVFENKVLACWMITD
jgi:hypothetical protein